VRWAIRSFLEEHGISTVGEASTAAEALDLAAIHEPDIIIMDLSLEDGSSIEATRTLSHDRGYRVLAFSAYDTPDCVEAFMQAGGAGFVSKAAPVKELITAINAAMDDRQWISPKLRVDQPVKKREEGKQKSDLSDREKEVASLIAKGLSSSQIADQLYVSLNTVETHRYRIFKKLQIHNRAQLVDYALQNGLLNTYPVAQNSPLPT